MNIRSIRFGTAFHANGNVNPDPTSCRILRNKLAINDFLIASFKKGFVVWDAATTYMKK